MIFKKSEKRRSFRENYFIRRSGTYDFEKITKFFNAVRVMNLKENNI